MCTMDKRYRIPFDALKITPIPLITAMGAALRLFRLSSAPPGLHFDEAVYGLMALDIYHGHFSVFFSAYTGREPLYMYFMAAVFRLVGVGSVGIRLTSALIGIATIPLAFLLFREMFSRRTGIIAAALTAFSYWHLTVSRNGYPNILIPPLESLALYFLWQGYRDGRRWFMALSGVFVGGVLYTYLAARLFPVTVAAFFLYTFLVDRKRFLSRLSGLLLAAVVSLLVFAPLGIHFLTHPHDFWERTSQVLAVGRVAQSELLRLIAGNFVQTLGGFFLRGDPRWHYNLPGKPIFDPIMAVFFVLGLFVAVRNWRKPEYFLLPIWVVGMCLPAVLTKDAMPQGQRMFGVIPAIFGLAAMGLEATFNVLTRRVGAKITYIALVALLAFEGLSTASVYFTNWARQRDTFYTFQSDYVLLARQAREELDAGHTVVIQSQHYKHPTIIFIEPRTLVAVWTVGGKSLVIPDRATGDVIYLRPTVDNPLAGEIEGILNRITEPVQRIPDPSGGTAVSVYRLGPEAMVQETKGEASASFNGEVEVLDWTVPSSIRRDQPLRVLMRWRVAKPTDEGRTLVLHLVDENGIPWSQGGETGYLSEQWHARDVVYQLFELRLPPGIPAGRYQTRLILSREDGTPLPVIKDGQLAGTSFLLSDVILETEGRFIQSISSAGVAFGEKLQAIAHSELKTTVGPGSAVQLAVTWQATAKMDENYAAVIELADEGGSVRERYEMPLAYQYPTSAWQPGEVVQALYPLSLRSLPAGSYEIHLRVANLTGELILGQVKISAGERIFTVPPIEHPLVAHLGNEIDLLGYDLDTGEYQAGETINLRLYWQARTPIAGDYKVFVHLVGEGEQIWSQTDSVPANWQRPTTGWQVGEIIVDEHSLAIKTEAPAGRYTIFVGMYDPATMQRLSLVDEAGQHLADDRLLLTTVDISQTR